MTPCVATKAPRSSLPLRPINPLRLTKQPSASTIRRQLNTPVQAALPALVPIIARTVVAGVLFYSSMNYVLYRGTRRDVEKAHKAYKESEEPGRAERKKMVDKLTKGKADE
jgi:type II secretory pathway component GspD/PulD (secretin)